MSTESSRATSISGIKDGVVVVRMEEVPPGKLITFHVPHESEEKTRFRVRQFGLPEDNDRDYIGSRYQVLSEKGEENAKNLVDELAGTASPRNIYLGISEGKEATSSGVKLVESQPALMNSFDQKLLESTSSSGYVAKVIGAQVSGTCILSETISGLVVNSGFWTPPQSTSPSYISHTQNSFFPLPSEMGFDGSVSKLGVFAFNSDNSSVGTERPSDSEVGASRPTEVDTGVIPQDHPTVGISSIYRNLSKTSGNDSRTPTVA